MRYRWKPRDLPPRSLNIPNQEYRGGSGYVCLFELIIFRDYTGLRNDNFNTKTYLGYCNIANRSPYTGCLITLSEYDSESSIYSSISRALGGSGALPEVPVDHTVNSS